jgi:hypothetical protein
MILDTVLCDYLIKKKMSFKIILFSMSFYYIILYTLLYLVVFKKEFTSRSSWIPSLFILLLFFIYNIMSIKKYTKSKIKY